MSRFFNVNSNIIVAIVATLCMISNSYAQTNGKKLFKAYCASCHKTNDVKLVGPGLQGMRDRQNDEWIIRFTKNSKEVIESGDAYAIDLFNEFNKIPMPPAPLQDEQIIAILDYVDATSIERIDSKDPDLGSADNSNEPEGTKGMGNWLYIIVAVVVSGFFVVTNYRIVKPTPKKKGEDPLGSKSLSDQIKDWTSRNKILVGLIVVLLIIGGLKESFDRMMVIGVYTDYAPEQPINFSHKIHADLEIGCVYCHSDAEKGKMAGIPSAGLCMSCHKAVSTGTTTGTTEIARIYEALDISDNPLALKYGENQKPIEWVRVHNLPDFVYFNHSQHVVVGQVTCQECHGLVEEMDVTRQFAPLTMRWCIDCHRTTDVKMLNNGYYEKIHAELKEKYKDQEGKVFTVENIGGLECAKCHY